MFTRHSLHARKVSKLNGYIMENDILKRKKERKKERLKKQTKN